MSGAAAVAGALKDPHRAPATRDAELRSMLAAANADRVLAVLGGELRAAGMLEQWPDQFRDALAVAEREAAAIDCIRQRELAAVLEALGAVGVRALLFKGAALAHTDYAAPHLRARTDTDILIPASDLPAVERTLLSLDYQPQHESSGELVSHQSHFGKRDRHALFHAIDVHWKISNRHALADRLGFEELWSQRRALKAVCASAWTVSAVHALLLALVHRAGHHPGSTNLLWLWDLHLLAKHMTDDELLEAANIAAARGLGAIGSEGLALARDWFDSPRLDAPIAVMLQSPRRTPDLTPGGSQADIVRQDLQALPTWRQRGRLVREHLFPSPNYIRGKYRARSALMLPALYAWRIVSGAPRWLRRADRT